MPEFPAVQGGVIRGAGATGGASSVATQLTAGGSANTKGSAVELVAATEFDANWVLVQFTGVITAAAPYLVDLMIGAATEQVIIPDMQVRVRAAGGDAGSYLFPLFIPKGSRLSARCQSSTGSATLRINVVLIAGTFIAGGPGPAMVSAYGAVAGSQGTNIDPGGTANTDSAWVEITPATERAHNWLCLGVLTGDLGLSASVSWRLSIGIGSAAEQVLIPDIHFSGDITVDTSCQGVTCLPVFIPAGSRLTARVRCSVTTDGDRDVWLKLYGAG